MIADRTMGAGAIDVEHESVGAFGWTDWNSVDDHVQE